MSATSEAKKATRAALAARGVKYASLSARAVSFADLARGGAVFVTVNSWQDFEPATFDAVRAEVRPAGIVLQVTQ